MVLKPYDAFMTTDFHHRVMLSLLPLLSLSSLLSLFTNVIISIIIIINIVIVDKYVHISVGYKTCCCVYMILVCEPYSEYLSHSCLAGAITRSQPNCGGACQVCV